MTIQQIRQELNSISSAEWFDFIEKHREDGRAGVQNLVKQCQGWIKKEEEESIEVQQHIDEIQPLSKRLFLKNIPSSIGKKELENIVSNQKGFIEVRYINIRGQAVAFIEFETIQQAQDVFNSSLFDSLPIDISFAND